MSDEEPEKKENLPPSILHALGLDPVERAPRVPTIPDTPNDDYAQVRKNIYTTLDKATAALDTLIDVADASQHPRAFEVVNQLVKTILDGNKDVLEIAKRKKDLGQSNEQTTIGTQHNQIIVATSQDILGSIRANLNKKIEDGSKD